MAVVNAVRGALNMEDLGFGRDADVTATQTNVRLFYGPGSYTDFGGQYQPGPSGSFSGTVESITNVVSKHTTFTVTDVDADAQRLFALIRAGDIMGAESYILRGDDSITGGLRGDTLYGFGGDDTIRGSFGRDILIGGEGKDTLNGGAGADRYVFTSTEDSAVAVAGRDVVQGFTHAEHDKIDLSAIDANEQTTDVNEAFHRVDHFTGAAGELVIKDTTAGFLVMGDTDGVGGADFSILVKSDTPLVPGDFFY